MFRSWEVHSLQEHLNADRKRLQFVSKRATHPTNFAQFTANEKHTIFAKSPHVATINNLYIDAL